MGHLYLLQLIPLKLECYMSLDAIYDLDNDWGRLLRMFVLQSFFVQVFLLSNMIVGGFIVPICQDLRQHKLDVI